MNRGAVEMIVWCGISLAVLGYQLICTIRTGSFRVGGKGGVSRQSITRRSHPGHYLFSWFFLLLLMAVAAAGIGTAVMWPETFAQHPIKTISHGA